MASKNIFKTATIIAVPEQTVKPGKKVEINLKGIEDYAHVDAVIKDLTAVKNALHEDLNDAMKAIFKKGAKRPENFKAIDGDASASCEMRRRASSSPLTPEEKAAFDKDKIPYDTLPLIPERYIINPEYMNDEKLLEKISAAISAIKGIPEDFILLQKGSQKYAVSEETISTVYEKKLVDKYFTTVSVLGIKPKLDHPNIKTSIRRAKEIIDIRDEKV